MILLREKKPIKILSDNDWMVWGMNSLKFSKQTKGDDCWVFRGLLIVLMLKQTLKIREILRTFWR